MKTKAPHTEAVDLAGKTLMPSFIEVPALIKEYAPDCRGGPMELPEEAPEAFGKVNQRLKLQKFKFALDGSPQGKTAFWSEPLLTKGPGGEENWRGQPLFPPEVVNKALKEVYDKGIQTWCHCNSDACLKLPKEDGKILDAGKKESVSVVDSDLHTDRSAVRNNGADDSWSRQASLNGCEGVFCSVDCISFCFVTATCFFTELLKGLPRFPCLVTFARKESGRVLNRKQS